VTKTKATNPDAHPKTLYYTHGIYPVVTLALRQTKLGQLLSGPSLVNQYFHFFPPATGCYYLIGVVVYSNIGHLVTNLFYCKIWVYDFMCGKDRKSCGIVN
jgi:hypothetical protein